MAVTINGDGVVDVGGNSSSAAKVRLYEDSDNGTNYIDLIAPASVASNRTITLPDNTGTVITTASTFSGTGPAFHAYMSNTQGASATVFTNVAFDAEAFDTASCFNNTGSTVGGIPAYAFLPNVAGYYQISTAVYNQAANQVNIIRLYKNGAYALELSRLFLASAPTLNGSGLVYLNGTTDYIQIYFYCSASTTIGSNDGALVWFQAAMVRAA